MRSNNCSVSVKYTVQQAIAEFQMLSLSKRGKVKNLSCEKDFYLHENKKSFWYPSSTKFNPATMDVTEFASFVTTAVGPRQTSQPRNPEVLGLRTALVVNSVFFLRVYFTRLNFPAILSKKRPKRSRYIFTRFV